MQNPCGRGAPAVLQIGRDYPSMTPVSLRQGAMWLVGHAPTLSKGHDWYHSATNPGRMACYRGISVYLLARDEKLL
jgi:hypothetical protein